MAALSGIAFRNKVDGHFLFSALHFIFRKKVFNYDAVGTHFASKTFVIASMRNWGRTATISGKMLLSRTSFV